MKIDCFLELLDSLNETEEKAFWNVVENLPDSIYSDGRVGCNEVKIHDRIKRDRLFAELLAMIKYHNVLLRIFKTIKGAEDLEERVIFLKEFYNNPANENAWRREPPSFN